jgi:hypothetical protein
MFVLPGAFLLQLCLLITAQVKDSLSDKTSLEPDISPDDRALDSESDDSEEDFSSFQAESLTQAYLNNLSSMVNSLYQVAFKIRNPAMRLGVSKAVKYEERDPDTGVNLIEAYASLDRAHIIELFGSFGHPEPEGHFLVHRLALANTRRRQQFRYWRRRRAQYESYSNLVEQVPAILQPAEIHIDHENHNLGPRPVAPSQPSTATWLNATQVNIETTSVISTKSFVNLDNEDSDIVPIPPPAIRETAREFECPYCFTICPRKTSPLGGK